MRRPEFNSNQELYQLSYGTSLDNGEKSIRSLYIDRPNAKMEIS